MPMTLLGQLTSFLQSTGYEEQYAYDKAGNMTEKGADRHGRHRNCVEDELQQR